MKYNVISSTFSKLSSSSTSYVVEVRDYSMSNIDVEFEKLFEDTISTYQKTPRYSYLYLVTHDAKVKDSVKLLRHLFVLYSDHVDIYTQDTESIDTMLSSMTDVENNSESVYISIITDFVIAYSPSLYLEEQYISTLESEFIKKNHPNLHSQISTMRKRISTIKRLCDSISRAIGSYSLSVSEVNSATIQDTVTMTDSLVENALYLRDFSVTVRESYQQQVDIGLNSTMKYMATVNTIFLPLMLLAGWYGMNVPMPEVKSIYSYPLIILFAITLTLTLIITFRRKKWF